MIFSREIGTFGIIEIIKNSISGSFWIIIAAFLSPNEYGEINYLITVAATGANFASIFTQNVITVFYAKKESIARTVTYTNLFVGLFSSITLLIIFEKIDLAVLVIGFILNNTFLGEFIGKKQFQKYGKYVITQKILMVAFCILVIIILDYSGFIIAITASYLIFLIHFFKKLKKNQFNLKIIITKKNFLVNNYVNLQLGYMINQIDRFLILPILGSTILGNYVLGIQFLTLLTTAGGLFYNYILTYDSRKINLIKLKKISIIISCLLTLGGIFILPSLIEWLFPQYIESIFAIQILSFVVVPHSLYLIFSSKLLSLEKSREILYANLCALIIQITLLISLGNYYGIIGASISYVVGSITMTIICFIYYKKNN